MVAPIINAAATDPAATTAADTTTADTGLLGIIDSLVRSNTGKGAAMGALLGQLLSSYKPAGGLNQGVDMSQLGKIAPRTTTIAPRYIPYSQYGSLTPVQQMSPEMMRNFGVSSSGLQYAPKSLASYSATPAMSKQAPQSFTSAGSGIGMQKNPTLTPRANNTISPLTGALMGSAIGYLSTPTTTKSAGGTGGSGGSGGSSSILDNVFNYLGKKFSTPGYQTDNNIPANIGSQDSGFPINSDIGYPNFDDYNSADYDNIYFKDGGMATPLMAEGGEVPHYYTYGQAINPSEILAGMAHGGQAHQGGLSSQVPTIEGRHDYRSGSRVTGEGTGQSDDIPAMLADGEYVFDADTVAALGDGSTKAGSDILDKFREELRSHKRSAPINKIPPPAKSPLAYLKAARSNKNG